ncbi:MAG: hypothetical protein VKO39_08685 [Cyanobacteriota bacterium]|nr:hypothetical protein [Cyanobacteriota bacterium]
MSLILFGSNNPTGAAFLDLCNIYPIEIWGRRPSSDSNRVHVYCDLTEISCKSIKPIKGILVSFAPIWLLASFLKHYFSIKPEMLQDLQGIIACSSSSFMTKRFAFNHYDKHLSSRLGNAHEEIKNICSQLNVPYQILAPAMVYGRVNGYSDKNLSKLVKIMRILPFIFLPKTTGFRQPIHATQLATIALRQANRMLSGHWPDDTDKIITVGGDSIISYQEMIVKIQEKLEQDDRAKKCRVTTIPDRIFFLFIIPLLPINPKLFEAMMRICSNLSDFRKAHELLDETSKSFPVLPLGTDY